MAKVAHFVFTTYHSKDHIAFTPDHGLIPSKNLLTHRKSPEVEQSGAKRKSKRMSNTRGTSFVLLT